MAISKVEGREFPQFPGFSLKVTPFIGKAITGEIKGNYEGCRTHEAEIMNDKNRPLLYLSHIIAMEMCKYGFYGLASMYGVASYTDGVIFAHAFFRAQAGQNMLRFPTISPDIIGTHCANMLDDYRCNFNSPNPKYFITLEEIKFFLREPYLYKAARQIGGRLRQDSKDPFLLGFADCRSLFGLACQ